jgi:protein-S-isoprenylcysteine O-methyltransferase Ste14
MGWIAGEVVLFLATVLAPVVDRRSGGPVGLTIGAGLLVAGGVLGFLAYQTLARSHAARSEPRPGSRLVTSGPYAWLRHPIYAAWIIGSLGYEIALGSVVGLAVVACLAIFYDRRARHEERLLDAAYPEYRIYRTSVARFIPGIH